MNILLSIAVIFIWIFLIFIIYIKYGYYENIVSPLNLYLLLNIIGCVIFLLFLIGDASVVVPSYFNIKNNYIDYNSFILTIVAYSISLLFVLLFLIIFKYRPIKVSILPDILSTKGLNIALLITDILYLYLIIKIYGMPLQINYENMVNFRYEVTHGVIVLLLLFALPISYLILTFNNVKSMIKKIYYIFSIVIFLTFFFLLNSRGSIIYPFLFILSINNSLSLYKIENKLYRLKIKRIYFYVLIAFFIIIIYYWQYSIYFRNQQANIFTLIAQRLDNFLASYMVIESKLQGYNIQHIIYPILSILPRFIFPDKPFPPNGELSKLLLNANLLGIGTGTWSVNFGLVGEAFFVLNGLFLPISSASIALSIYFYRKIMNCSKIGYLKYLILTSLYTMPFGILMTGLLTPAVGNLIIIIAIFAVTCIIKVGAKYVKNNSINT